MFGAPGALGIAVACFLLAASSASALELSSARPIAVLVGKGGPPVALGARDLRRHLTRITGRQVSEVRKGAWPRDAILVHVGRTPFVAERYGAKLDGLPRAESYIIETAGDQLVLAGKGGQGSLNATIEFLRQHCGVEQYLPGELGTVYTRPAPIVLDEMTHTHTPPLFHRLMYVPARNKREWERTSAWRRFHHVVQGVDFHHNLYRLLKQTKYAKDHPKYFSFVDGQRRVFKKDVSSAWQPCMTNAQGIKAVADEIVRIFDSEPGRLSVSIAVNDGGNYCECENCKPLWLDQEGEFGVCGKLYYTYAARIAEIVAKKYPDRVLGCLGYSSTGVPPDGMKAHPMVMPFVTIASERTTTDAIWAEYIKRPVDQVARNTHQFGVYEYIHGAGTFIPFIFDARIEQTIKYAYSKGCRAVYLETGQQNWGLDVYKYALALRLLWNPELDVAAWKDRFFSSFYGPSGPAMRRYFAACEQAWARVEHLPVLHRKEEQMSLFTEELLADCGKALAEASDNASDDIVMQRILMTRRAFAASAALVRRYWAGVKAQELLDKTGEPAATIDTLAAVAGRELDYEVLYQSGPAHEPYVTIEPPGEGSVRMQATYTEARTQLYRSALTRVVAQVRKRPDLRPGDVALREVQRLFAKTNASPGKSALMFEAMQVGACVARARRVPKAPLLDGQLNDEVWQASDVLGNFAVYGKGGLAKYHTTVRVVRTEDTLFLGFDCKQSPDALWAAAGLRDGNVWTDDSIEFLVNRPDEKDPDKFMQAIVNVEGVIFDRKGSDKSWNGPFRVKPRATKDGWQLEMAIPMSAIRPYIVDGALHVNFVRNKQKTRMARGVRVWVIYDEISNWFPAFKGNVDLVSRGWLLLD